MYLQWLVLLHAFLMATLVFTGGIAATCCLGKSRAVNSLPKRGISLRLIAFCAFLFCIHSSLLVVTGKPWRQALLPCLVALPLIHLSRTKFQIEIVFWFCIAFTTILPMQFLWITSGNKWTSGGMEVSIKNQLAIVKGKQLGISAPQFENQKVWHSNITGFEKISKTNKAKANSSL